MIAIGHCGQHTLVWQKPCCPGVAGWWHHPRLGVINLGSPHSGLSEGGASCFGDAAFSCGMGAAAVLAAAMAVCCCGCMLPCLSGACRGSKFLIPSLVSNPSPCYVRAHGHDHFQRYDRYPCPWDYHVTSSNWPFTNLQNPGLKSGGPVGSMIPWLPEHEHIICFCQDGEHWLKIPIFLNLIKWTHPPAWVGGMLSPRGLTAKRTFITTSDTVSSWSVSWVGSSWDHDLWPPAAQVAHQSNVGNPVQTRREYLNYSCSHHFKVWGNNHKGTCMWQRRHCLWHLAVSWICLASLRILPKHPKFYVAPSFGTFHSISIVS